MRVLSLYTHRDLNILRRVIAPFSCLTTRGHSFHAQQVQAFNPDISYAYDVTVLSNAILDDHQFEQYLRVLQERSIVYDLSTPSLLQDSRVQEMITHASLVTVPNDFLLGEVQTFNKRVRVLPSVIDLPYFMQGRKVEAEERTIGCFGPHDWHLVRPALEALKEDGITFLGDRFAYGELGDLVEMVSCTPDTYPMLLNRCAFGLCPMDGNKGQDTIWGLEYGILWKPVIVQAQSPYSRIFRRGSALFVDGHDPLQWKDSILLMLRHPQVRAKLAKEAFALANEGRTTKLAGTYLSTYTKMLPHLLMA